VTLKDYFRAKLLAASEKDNADLDEIDREEERDAEDVAAAAPASYHEEAAAAKHAFLSALGEDVDGNAPAAADDSWFVAKAKSAGQSHAEAEEAKAFVAGLKGKKLAKGDRQFLDFIVSGEAALNPQERWLRQYVWGDGWKKGTKDGQQGGDSDGDDEEHVEQMEEFETKYNFRFEEPGATVITAYGRKEGEGFDASLRRKDNSRSEKRKRREERQAKEKQQRKEELKTLRNLKKQEAQAKLEQLRDEAGKKKISKKILKPAALEDDFDPEEHDRMMQAMFDDDYYDEEEDEDALRALGLSKDDEGIDEAAAEEDLDAILKSKGRLRPKDRSKSSEAEQKFIENELAEVDAADFEDVIGDLPTRFKYREVPAISIKSKAQPLTPLQILTMDDDELNKLEPLKIIAAPYRCFCPRLSKTLSNLTLFPFFLILFCFALAGRESSRCGKSTMRRAGPLAKGRRAATSTRAGSALAMSFCPARA
jgi:protein KRI1